MEDNFKLLLRNGLSWFVYSIAEKLVKSVKWENWYLSP